ncbi:hypothetical protein [Hasllibacter sp. MH4015]|uniref:hypothetical protein n=1 Tax=Hasllibacter sp. MH4015 TaxID=2854029 RepID=UPI001CD46D55|nr:hypothetical protein [Hasllibacter sp. MH4015]
MNRVEDELIVVHAGFDGLDLAIRTNTPESLVTFLEEGKAVAQEMLSDIWSTFNGRMIQVGQSGKRGGYAYTFKVDGFGATWFAKRPKATDPWGLFVSLGSRELALHGLVKTQARLEEICAELGFRSHPDGVSINRADFAVDILAPSFEPNPDHFVFHSRMNRKDRAQFEDLETNGHSGRITSVTIGKMPGRQVILYDKREEVMKRRKNEWPVIWNAALRAQGLSPISLADRESSQVWRAEFRLGKEGLRRRRNIRNWSAFYMHLQEEMDRLATDIQLTRPTTDSNRSRWPAHAFWARAQRTLAKQLFDHDAEVPAQTIAALDHDQKCTDLLKMIAALSVTLAYHEGKCPDTFPLFCAGLTQRIQRFIANHPRSLVKRFAEAAKKHGSLAH